MWLWAVFHVLFDIYTLQGAKLWLTSYSVECAHVFSDVFWAVAGCCDTVAAVHVGILCLHHM